MEKLAVIPYFATSIALAHIGNLFGLPSDLLIQSKNVNEFKSAIFLFNIEAVSECDMYAEHN